MNRLALFKNHDYSVTKTPAITVVLIHGIASDSSTFNHALNYLENEKKINARFITYDLLGAGKSQKNDDLEYNYDEQLEALDYSLELAEIKTPLILVGHSLGTFIVTRYASENPKKVNRLILVSPPVYTKEDLKNPAFMAGIKVFEDAVSVKDPSIVKEKSFKNSMQNIVMNKDNYDTLLNISIPTDMIYGVLDRFIATYNLPRVAKANRCINLIGTPGHHGVSREKYFKLGEILEKEINETI